MQESGLVAVTLGGDGTSHDRIVARRREASSDAFYQPFSRFIVSGSVPQPGMLVTGAA